MLLGYFQVNKENTLVEYISAQNYDVSGLNVVKIYEKK